jgi:site-specific DNA recombinase
MSTTTHTPKSSPHSKRAAVRTQTAGVVRAAIYARYSSVNQSPFSADDQIKGARFAVESGRLATKRYAGCTLQIMPGWEVKDEALSGRSTAGRDGYEKIRRGVAQREFDLLIVDDLSRLTRDLGDMLDLWDLLKYHGVECYSICDGLSSEDESARNAFTIKGVINDFANQSHASRTVNRMVTRFIDGYSTGRLPYGYVSEAETSYVMKGQERPTYFRIKINEARAEVVRNVFEWYAAGWGRVRIAKKLNALGRPSPGRSHSHEGPMGGWDANHVKSIISQARYAGAYAGGWTYRDTSMIKVPNSKKKRAKANGPDVVVRMKDDIAEQLAIVPPELWDRVQEIRAANRDVRSHGRNGGEIIFGARLGKSAPEHLVSGIFKCDVCGGNIVLACGNDGGRYGCYNAHRNQGRCVVRRTITRTQLEGALVDTLRYILEREPWLERLTSAINRWVAALRDKAPKTREGLQADIKRLGNEIRNLTAVLAAGTTEDLQPVLQALKEREHRKRQLELELRQLTMSTSSSVTILPAAVKAHLERFLKALQAAPLTVSVSLRAALPGGVPLVPPTDGDDIWIARLRLDGVKLLSFPQHRVAVGAGSPEPTHEPEPSGGGQGGGTHGDNVRPATLAVVTASSTPDGTTGLVPNWAVRDAILHLGAFSQARRTAFSTGKAGRKRTPRHYPACSGARRRTAWWTTSPARFQALDGHVSGTWIGRHGTHGGDAAVPDRSSRAGILAAGTDHCGLPALTVISPPRASPSRTSAPSGTLVNALYR